MKSAFLVLSSLVAIGALAVIPTQEREAYAQNLRPLPKANADVLIIHAKEGPAFVDPLIGNMPQLSQAPFKSYTNFRLLDKQSYSLEKGKPSSELKLITGNTLQLLLSDIDKEKRFKINVALSGKSKLDFVASPGVPFFLAGQPYNGGVLIIGVVVKP